MICDQLQQREMCIQQQGNGHDELVSMQLQEIPFFNFV